MSVIFLIQAINVYQREVNSVELKIQSEWKIIADCTKIW